jgi:hypothetical protein
MQIGLMTSAVQHQSKNEGILSVADEGGLRPVLSASSPSTYSAIPTSG